MNMVEAYIQKIGYGKRSLELVGLEAPCYYTNAFMLQAIIFNKNAFSEVKIAIGDEKLHVDVKKLAIEGEKLAIEKMILYIQQKNYSEPTKLNIIKIYNEVDVNRVFESKEIEQLLGCHNSTARLILGELKDIDVVKVIMGKDRYIFKNNGE